MAHAINQNAGNAAVRFLDHVLREEQHELRLAILSGIPLLRDKLSLGICLANKWRLKFLSCLLTKHEETLMRNEELCKVIFESSEFKRVSRSPLKLRPDHDDPEDLTYNELILEECRRGDLQSWRNWELERDDAITKYRGACGLRSRPFKEKQGQTFSGSQSTAQTHEYQTWKEDICRADSKL